MNQRGFFESLLAPLLIGRKPKPETPFVSVVYAGPVNTALENCATPVRGWDDLLLEEIIRNDVRRFEEYRAAMERLERLLKR